MPQQFEGLGLNLLYPDNWRLEQDTGAVGGDGVSFESPQGAFLAINRYDAIDAQTAVESAQQTMQSEYEEVETEEIRKSLAGHNVVIIAQRFYYLDFVISSQLLSFSHSGHTYLVQIQGEDRDVDRLQDVFDAMLVSIFQNFAN